LYHALYKNDAESEWNNSIDLSKLDDLYIIRCEIRWRFHIWRGFLHIWFTSFAITYLVIFDDYDQKWCRLNDTRTWHIIYCQDPFFMQIHNIKSEFQYSIRVTCYKVVCAKIYNKRLITS